MFKPSYTISNKLLSNIKQIGIITGRLNHKKFPTVVLHEFERMARETSSHTSTKIEGNPLPLTEVKRIIKSRPEYLRQTEKEVLNYNDALLYLNEKIEKERLELSKSLILKIHSLTMKDLLPTSDVGKFRNRPVVIGNPRTNDIIYIPPDTDEVGGMMDELITFTNENSGTIDPLILAGLFHKQMVLIHPFIDGNGRSTRLTTKTLLAEMGLDTFNLFSFENFYSKNISRYFLFVGESGDYYEIASKINFTLWLEYFTEGIIDELLRVEDELGSRKSGPDEKLQKHHLQIIKIVEKQGYATDRDYAKVTNRAKATRALDFKRLIEMGIVKRQGKGKRTSYVSAPNAS